MGGVLLLSSCSACTRKAGEFDNTNIHDSTMADQAKKDLEYPFMDGVIFQSDDEHHAPSGTEQDKQGEMSGVQGKKAGMQAGRGLSSDYTVEM